MRIAAVAHRTPSRRVDNEDLILQVIERNAERYGPAERSILRQRLREYFEQTGVSCRFWRADGEKAVTLGLEAGEQALEEAEVRPEEIDLLIYAGVGRGWIEPAMANLFLAELGLVNATGFDVGDACASWLRALDIVSGFIRTGRCRKAVILNCECNINEYCDFAVPDLESLEYLLAGFTIGEAATATVVTDESPDDRYRAVFRTWGAHHGLCRIPLPNQAQYEVAPAGRDHGALRFYAYGTALTRTTVKRLVATYHSDPFFRSLEPDICFGHSVSEAVTTEVEDLLRLPKGTAYRTVSTHGNTVSASLPLGMSLASRDGALVRGQTVLFVMGSAGISVGLAAIRF